MAMVVKNNMLAVSTLNTLNKNSAALAKSLQKVSSGMKINSAADDASGYAISERMRVQIRGLDQANQNTQNGTSMMKVAEGAVSSTVDILKTLKEKAINAANDTNTDSDRQTIQKEFNQSIDQIDDNANVTYNGKYLVDGSKGTVGKATYAALTNENLSADTTANTKLTDLKRANGDDLELHDTDKVTVSYVQGGKTYTTTFQIGYTDDKGQAATHTLGDIFQAAEDIDKTSDVFANAGNRSVYKASNGTGPESDYEKYLTTGAYNDANTHKKAYTAYTTKVAAANTALGDVSDATSAAGRAAAAVAAYNAAQTESGKQITIKASDYADSYSYIHALANDTNYQDFATGASKEEELTVGEGKKKASELLADAKAAAEDQTVKDADTAAGQYKAAGQYTDADKKLMGPAVLSGKNIGLAASDDMVSTASGKNAITVTANTAGIAGQISGLTISFTDSQGNELTSANAAMQFSEGNRALNASDDNAVTLQVGTKANQSIKVGLTDMRSEALGLKGADGTKLNISTQDKANAAINVLDNALQKALDQQTTIGSVQSRLSYTSSNLTTASENVQSSESTIRDADMAKEMTEYTKNNVLLQAAQSMLAQANQSSSSVLSLLQ
ncbi:MAG: Flagellin [Selenomonas sp.]|jgi:flagellin